MWCWGVGGKRPRVGRRFAGSRPTHQTIDRPVIQGVAGSAGAGWVSIESTRGRRPGQTSNSTKARETHDGLLPRPASNGGATAVAGGERLRLCTRIDLASPQLQDRMVSFSVKAKWRSGWRRLKSEEQGPCVCSD